jgi:hypothetical protein
MHDLAVQKSAPAAIDDLPQEQPGDQEEVRHAERLGEGHHRVHEALVPGRLLDPERRMHNHHEDDAEPLGIVDPVDPAGGGAAAGAGLGGGCATGHVSSWLLGFGIRLRPSHFDLDSSHMRTDELHSRLPIQVKCQGWD